MAEKLILNFSTGDVELFSQASRDRNPLHLSADYARKTPYAQPVVFGILGALFCFGYLPDRPGYQLCKLKLEFPGPLFANIDYGLEISDQGEKAIAKIYDGRRLLLKLVAQFRPGSPVANSLLANSASNPEVPFRSAAAQSDSADWAAGKRLSGSYSPAHKAFQTLMARMNAAKKGLGEVQAAALLGCSYLIGMELPGQQALFSKLSLDFSACPQKLDSPLEYELEIADFDLRFNLLRLNVGFTQAAAPFASGELRAFVRSDSPVSTVAAIAQRLPTSSQLAGKVALVTGASRGLGSAIAQALAFQGCTVLANFHRSQPEAEALAQSVANTAGQIILMQGDASDLAWCQSARAKIEQTWGRLDILVCNACPAILPLWLEPSAIERVNDYVSRSLALMSVPMSGLLGLVPSGGRTVVLSSVVAVDSPPSDWPHYVSAKCAIEGLTRVAAVEYPQVGFLMVRPPKLLTDQMNTPLGREGALSTELVSAKIVERLAQPLEAGRAAILSDFAPS
ncbi:SDR family NAD(P)-dependent oxidoreductase [Romeria aff. gracilis LEGE 07310]|uniref:SDR family NAD(P)-dependent oxidoreductase n=1 Tax=Vasconcelosia minhoensis LEGE 07310 TaxID=915328 RepID=A0A8J7AVN4_9CYAN|nr:SDR family NAD(P)-dependent oxidoreductase [Romeria gracilis]MBE9076497.1 SDR family NAD(P)-dependent oxidoreductase [Romeria aff. gracilis LEGE 07310]